MARPRYRWRPDYELPVWVPLYLQPRSYLIGDVVFFVAESLTITLELTSDFFRILCAPLLNLSRRWFGPPNDKVAAARIPPELLLNIFRYLSPPSSYLHETPRFRTAGDRWRTNRRTYSSIIAARSVCRAWRGPATEAFFHTVLLRSTRSMVLFVETVAGNSELAHFIVALKFGDHVLKRQYILDAPAERFQLLAELVGRASQLQLSAIDNEVKAEVDDEDVIWQDDRIFGLSNCTSRTTHLRLEGTFVRTRHRIGYLRVASHAVIYSARFQNLAVLDLEYLVLLTPPPVSTPWPRLRALTLRDCRVSLEWMRSITQQALSLLYLDVHQPVLYEIYRDGNSDIASILGQHTCARLHHLALSFTFGGADRLGWFINLRSLRISCDSLRDAGRDGKCHVPPALEEVIIECENTPQDSERFAGLQGRGIRSVSQCIINDASHIRRELVKWKAAASSLRRVEIRDMVGFTTWKTWNCVACLLPDSLARHGMEVTIHLTLGSYMEDHYRDRFEVWRRPTRPLRWKDTWMVLTT